AEVPGGQDCIVVGDERHNLFDVLGCALVDRRDGIGVCPETRLLSTQSRQVGSVLGVSVRRRHPYDSTPGSQSRRNRTRVDSAAMLVERDPAVYRLCGHPGGCAGAADRRLVVGFQYETVEVRVGEDPGDGGIVPKSVDNVWARVYMAVEYHWSLG